MAATPRSRGPAVAAASRHRPPGIRQALATAVAQGGRRDRKTLPRRRRKPGTTCGSVPDLIPRMAHDQRPAPAFSGIRLPTAAMR